MLWAFGSSSGGISVFVQNDRLVVDYNAFGDHVIVESETPIPVGASELSMQSATIVADHRHRADRDRRRPLGTAELPLMMRQISMLAASIGSDHGSTVSARYDDEFAFSGTLHEVEIRLDGGPERGR